MMLEEYNTNDKFREYVDKYAAKHKISVEEALMHETVKQYCYFLKSNQK